MSTEISPPTGSDVRTVERVASRYTGHEYFGKPDVNSSHRLSRYPVTSQTQRETWDQLSQEKGSQNIEYVSTELNEKETTNNKCTYEGQ
jgi:hypothetical protein